MAENNHEETTTQIEADPQRSAEPTAAPAFNGTGWDEMCPHCRADISEHVTKLTEPARQQGRDDFAGSVDKQIEAAVNAALEKQQAVFTKKEQELRGEINRLTTYVKKLKSQTVEELEERDDALAEVEDLEKQLRAAEEERNEIAYDDGKSDGRAEVIEEIELKSFKWFDIVGDRIEFDGQHFATLHPANLNPSRFTDAVDALRSGIDSCAKVG